MCRALLYRKMHESAVYIKWTVNEMIFLKIYIYINLCDSDVVKLLIFKYHNILIRVVASDKLRVGLCAVYIL